MPAAFAYLRDRNVLSLNRRYAAGRKSAAPRVELHTVADSHIRSLVEPTSLFSLILIHYGVEASVKILSPWPVRMLSS